MGLEPVELAAIAAVYVLAGAVKGAIGLGLPTVSMAMLGIDFSGLELRVLSNYLHTFDNGDFKKSLLEDDIHAKNKRILGLDSRDKA